MQSFRTTAGTNIKVRAKNLEDLRNDLKGEEQTHQRSLGLKGEIDWQACDTQRQAGQGIWQEYRD